MAHDRQVVRDEEIGEPELALQVVEQVEHPRLHADVERADGLVEHQDLGLDGERAGDADPLALPAGELVGMPRRVLRVEADELQQLADALVRRPACRPWIDERLGDGRPTVIRGFEGGVGVLEHELHAAADRAERLLADAR